MATRPHEEARSEAVLIRVETLVDGSGEAPIADAGIWVQGDRIVRAGAWSDGGWPEGEKVRRLRAAAAIPGLIDIHAHITDESDLGDFLREGVTSVRDMGTGLDLPVLRLRDEVNRGDRMGPRIFSFGVLIDGPRTIFPSLAVTVSNENQARAEVNRMAEAGVDGIKVYWKMPQPLMVVCIAQARKHGLPIAGHIGMLVGGVQGGQMGLDSVEHTVSFMRDIFPRPIQAAMGMLLRLGMMDVPAKGVSRLFDFWSKLKPDSPRIERIVDGFARSGAAFHPTLVCFERLAASNDPKVRNDPRVLEKRRNPQLNELYEKLAPLKWRERDFARSRAGMEKMQAFVLKMYEGGSRIGAGTDVSAPCVLPGESLHREIQLLAAAGISPVRAIRMATWDNARTLRRDDLGRIAGDMTADLVLLDRDPRRDLSATTEIGAVFKGGVQCSVEPGATQ